MLVTNTVELFASSSVALSLFVIGGTIANVRIFSVGKRVQMIVAGKLLVMPAAVWMGLSFLELLGYSLENKTLKSAAIIMAATPSMSIYPLLAQQYGEEKTAATALLLMTIVSFFTLSLLLFIL